MSEMTYDFQKNITIPIFSFQGSKEPYWLVKTYSQEYVFTNQHITQNVHLISIFNNTLIQLDFCIRLGIK